MNTLCNDKQHSDVDERSYQDDDEFEDLSYNSEDENKANKWYNGCK